MSVRVFETGSVRIVAGCVNVAVAVLLSGSVALSAAGCSRETRQADEPSRPADGAGRRPMEDPFEITDGVKNHVARLLSRTGARTELQKAVALYRSVIPSSRRFRLRGEPYRGYTRDEGGLEIPFGDDSSAPLRKTYGSLLPGELIGAPEGQRMADCLEYGFLLVALLRAAGIEARLGERPDHAYAVAILGGKPYRLDAANLVFEPCKRLGEPDRVGIALHHSNEGVIRKEQGRLEEAARYLDTAIALRPGFAEALVNRGLVLREQGKLGEAIRFYDRALGVDPHDARAWSNKGVALAGQGKLEQAMGCYDRALRLDPKYHKPWNNKGTLFFRGGRLAEAIQCYDRALGLKPDYAKAWYNRGLALRARGDLEGAVACFERALAIEPDKAAAWFGKGVALERQGKQRQARECYHRAEALGFSATEE